MSGNGSRPRAVVKDLWQETPRLVGATLSVPADIAAAYERPGQYVVLHPDNGAKPVFMAIASGPGGAGELELLVGPHAASLLELAPGKALAIDPPAGKGYPVDLARGRDLLLFAVGSGMSAIRSVIEYVRAHRAEFGRVVLYTGAKSDAEHAYRDEETAWLGSRIEIVRAISRPWVQDLFRVDPVPVDNAVAFVCGMKDMVAGVTEVLVAAGMSPDRIRQNF